ncbi:MAG: universal stress protein [Deltaproteobacteria bacterium]|nr:universal stress protein [Deltaproteobacteria bacterium]
MRIEPKKIMCAIDFSDFTNIILSYGKALAKEFESKLCLCHVVQGALMVSSHMPPYLDYAGIESERSQCAQDKLEKIAKEFDIDCEILISAGNPADEIEQLARDNNVDMIIAATHGGSGVKRFLIGSVTNRLVKILTCPLLVLHAKENHLVSPVEDKIKLKRILVGCDFSRDSKLAFDYALSLAQEFQTQLYLAHVIRPTEQIELTASDYIKLQEGDYIGWSRSEYLDLQKKTTGGELQKKSTLRNRLETQLLNMVPEDSRNWCTPVTILLEGQAYKELIDYAGKKEVDMIVLGVRGHSLLEQFLVGSTTDRVISQASCPVLAVRHIT